jgi:VWFA-related protein
MRLAGFRILFTSCLLTLTWLGVSAQDVTRELNVSAGANVEIVNLSGRVAVKAEAGTEDARVAGGLTASSTKGVSDGDVKIAGSGSHTVITVTRSEAEKRIDLTIILPERCKLKIETGAGAIEAVGNFAAVDAKTGTGTIVTDVPDDDIKYNLLWTESRPRYIADFDIEKVKEKSAGRFEIKGRHLADGEVKTKNAKRKTEDVVPTPDSTDGDAADPKAKAKTKQQKPKPIDSTAIDLTFTTARGIILLNVPPSEVMSDLRERPLTEAAKAIVRSGDSLLMDAIRRASPKYFGDYARTLPPLKREPSLLVRTSQETTAAPLKTALVRVTDLNNRAIASLTAKDFEVTENGASREIVSVERSTAPFNLVLLLDVSGSVENYVNFIRKTARAFVDTVDKNDRISIVTFNDDVKVVSRFTTDKNALSKSLDSFDAGGGTAYYDALAYTLSDTLRPLKGDRTAIVVLTDGDDNRSFLAFDSLLGSIQESGALIYPLYVPSGLIAAAAANPNADIDPMRRKYMSLSVKSVGEGERLAKVSGGVYYPIEQISQIQRAYEDIALQLRTAYNITFRSDATNVGGNGVSPRLKIKAKQANTFATITAVAPAATAQK